MKRRAAVGTAVILAVAYLAFGAMVRAARAPRMAAQAGEIRGAYHVHTNRSDGRGTLAEVVRAAKEAGLQFVVVTDHNVLAPEDQGFHDGVLVIEGTEASTASGHVVALGVARSLTAEERERDPFGAIAALGGQAIIAHPLHPRRPFTGWGRGPWRGFEVVSNDTAWYAVLHGHRWARAALAALVFPWDGARAVLHLGGSYAAERARFDAELRAARASGEKRRPAKVLLCSADAHGYPSYRSAFEAFSMHLPLRLGGDARADAAAVSEALVEGRGACVLDGVAPAGSVSLSVVSNWKGGRAIDLAVDAPDLTRAEFTLLRDGSPVGTARPTGRAGTATLRLDCGGAGCGPGDYRVEGAWDRRPWIFTNPVAIE